MASLETISRHRLVRSAPQHPPNMALRAWLPILNLGFDCPEDGVRVCRAPTVAALVIRRIFLRCCHLTRHECTSLHTASSASPQIAAYFPYRRALRCASCVHVECCARCLRRSIRRVSFCLSYSFKSSPLIWLLSVWPLV